MDTLEIKLAMTDDVKAQVQASIGESVNKVLDSLNSDLTRLNTLIGQMNSDVATLNARMAEAKGIAESLIARKSELVSIAGEPVDIGLQS